MTEDQHLEENDLPTDEIVKMWEEGEPVQITTTMVTSESSPWLQVMASSATSEASYQRNFAPPPERTIFTVSKNDRESAEAIA